MTNYIKLHPIQKIQGTIFLPGSKSISNRALLLAAQSIGTTRLTNLLDSDDVHYMLNALNNLGIVYRLSNDRKTCEIDGIGGALQVRSNQSVIISLGNAGTAVRSLIAALSIKSKNIVITGDQRMLKRPISHLITALEQGGGQFKYIKHTNYLPIKILGGYQGGNIIIKGNISSQFLSAILMISPLATHNTYIKVDGTLVSKPYIDITLSIMQDFGVKIQHENYNNFYCQGNNQYISPKKYHIEGDASSASYFLAAAAIKGGTVKVFGISKYSKQGDIFFANILNKMGAIISWGKNYIECTKGNQLNSIDMDVNNITDAAMTLAVTSLFVTDNKPTTLRNIYNWRVKESDRLAAMATELRKVGAIITEGYDYLYIKPPFQLKSAHINTYNDHRIAMCFALIALSNIPIIIHNPQCTSKTFPDFFNQLNKISNDIKSLI